MIIESHGEVPDPHKFRGRCTNCNCLVWVKQDELYNYYGGDQREPGGFGYVKCPTCGQGIQCYEISKRGE